MVINRLCKLFFKAIIFFKDEEHLSDLTDLRVLAIDEIDRMVQRGHFKELDHIVHRIHAK